MGLRSKVCVPTRQAKAGGGEPRRPVQQIGEGAQLLLVGGLWRKPERRHDGNHQLAVVREAFWQHRPDDVLRGHDRFPLINVLRQTPRSTSARRTASRA